MLPAASVAASVTSNWVSGSASKSVVGTFTLKLPCSFTLPVKVLPLTATVTTSPGRNSPVALPVTGKVCNPASWAVIRLSAVTSLTANAATGGFVSTLTTKGALALVTPSAVVDAVRLCTPSAKGVVGVNVHAPSGLAVVVPKTVSPSRMVTTAPGEVRPLNVGVASLVAPFETKGTLAPSGLPTLSVTLSMTGASSVGVPVPKAAAATPAPARPKAASKGLKASTAIAAPEPTTSAPPRATLTNSPPSAKRGIRPEVSGSSGMYS